jgi:hypothetical protein
MNAARFYDPPFLLKMVLLVCLVLVATAHRKGWMSRTMVDTKPYASVQAATVAPAVATQP